MSTHFTPGDPVPGKPDTATKDQYALLPPEASGKPTKKVAAAAITGAVLLGISLIVDVTPAIEQAVNLVVPIIVAYFVPNDPTTGGVPPKVRT